MAKRDQDVHFLASKEEVERIHEKMDELLWSSVFVTLVAKKYRFMQFELDRVFDTR